MKDTTYLFDNYLVGTDPEMFAIDSNGNCVPPFILRMDHGLRIIGGKVDDKGFMAHPEFYYGPLITFKAMIKVPSFVVMEDGAAFETPIMPSNNSRELYTRVALAKLAVKDILEDYGLKLWAKPVINFNSNAFSRWSHTPDFDFAVRFGCDKDYDIYDGKYSCDIDASKILQRFAGGHAHTSSTEIDLHDLHIPFTKLMDIAVGNLFVAHTPYPVEESMRQKYYGRPGKIRFPTYPDGTKGIEYRTPSISLWDSFESIDNLFKAINWVIYTLNDTRKCLVTIKEYLDISINNILTFDQKNAKIILETLRILR